MTASGTLAALLGLLGLAGASAAAPPLQAAAETILGHGQAAFVRAEDGTVLAAVDPDRPLHPASVTKVATTLALLERLGPEHRFATTLLAAGPLRDGTLGGDLVVEAGGDPVLVYESAFLMLLALRERDVRVVGGGLRVRGPLAFNWQPDPRGRAFRRALEGEGGEAAWAAVREARDGSAPARLREAGLGFAGAASAAPGSARPLLVYRSPPLTRVLKALNCYSNNVFRAFSAQVGGPEAVQRTARAHVAGSARETIVIDDAAGLGTTNRMSPRAAAALVDALAGLLERHGLALADVLPLAGADPGTLRDRLAGGAVVGKTGTIGSLGVSALAGRAQTERFGVVTFAILGRGLPVPEAQRRQDALVRALLDAGGPRPWPARAAAPPLFADAEIRDPE